MSWRSIGVVDFIRPGGAAEWRYEDTGHDLRWHLIAYGKRVGCLVSKYDGGDDWRLWADSACGSGAWLCPNYPLEQAKERLIYHRSCFLPHYNAAVFAAEIKEQEMMYGIS